MNDIFRIKEKLWNGSINITIILQPDSDHEPIEYLTTIYRNSYLPMYFESMVTYFRNYIDIKEPIWLSYNNKPIKWNLPVGILYDTLHLPSNINEEPWKLIFNHGPKYPTDIIPFIYKYPDDSINYEKSLTENYFNQLKQSCYVMNGNSKMVMNLSKDDSESLWKAIKNHDLDQFTHINNKIISRKVTTIPVKVWAQDKVIHFRLEETESLENILEKFDGNYYIHGISSEHLLSKPISEVWNLFKYLDDFLYIVIY